MPEAPHDSAPRWLPPFDDGLVEHARKVLDESGGVLIVGQPGSGRLDLARRVAEPGPLLLHRGTIAGRATPYFALRRLAPTLDIPLDATSADLVLAMGRRAARGGPPPTIALLGIDLCDLPSLSTLIERSRHGEVRLIGTIRPEALAHHPIFRTSHVIELPPLGRADISRHLAHRFSCYPGPIGVEYVRSRSQGAYDAMVTVAEDAVDRGRLGAVDGTLTLIPDRDAPDEPLALPSPDSFALHELLGTDSDLADLLQIVAIVEEADIHELLAALPSAPLDRVLSHGILKVVGEVVSFVVAAEGEAVASSLTLPRRADLHDTYSAQFTRTFERPRPALRAALCRREVRRTVEPELAARAARQANLEGLYHDTLKVTAPSGPGEPVWGAMERAFALVELGRVDELITLMQGLDPLTLTEAELVDFLVLRRHYLDVSPSDDDARSADAETARRRRAAVQLVRLGERTRQGASSELEGEIRALVFSGLLCPVNTARGYLALSAVQRNTARPEHAVESARSALALLRADPFCSAAALDPAYEALILALLDLLELGEAEATLLEYSTRRAPHGRPARMGHAVFSILAHHRGWVTLGRTHAQLALRALDRHDPQGVAGWLRAVTAELLAQEGRPDEALALLAEPDLQPRAARIDYELERRVAEGAAYDAVGRYDQSTALLLGVVHEARRHGMTMTEINAAALLVQVGGRASLPALAAAVRDVEDSPGRPRGLPAVWRRFVTAVEAEDLTALFALVAHLADIEVGALAAEIARFTLVLAESVEPTLSVGERLLLEHTAFQTPLPVNVP
jgi:hypothetical protein